MRWPIFNVSEILKKIQNKTREKLVWKQRIWFFLSVSWGKYNWNNTDFKKVLGNLTSKAWDWKSGELCRAAWLQMELWGGWGYPAPALQFLFFENYHYEKFTHLWETDPHSSDCASRYILHFSAAWKHCAWRLCVRVGSNVFTHVAGCVGSSRNKDWSYKKKVLLLQRSKCFKESSGKAH